MDLTKVADNTTEIHADDSTIYLFGSKLYCGWCLESFTCPVRLKIHCHIEHLATCSCGERYRDRETLCKHVARSGCYLPPPFKWSHFLKLPCGEVSKVCSNDMVDETTSSESSGIGESVQKFSATEERRTLLGKRRQICNKESHLLKRGQFCCVLCPFRCSYPSEFERHTRQKHRDVHKSMSLNSCHEVSEKSDDYVGVENEEAVLGILSKDTAILRNATVDKFGYTSPSMASSDVSEKFYCKKHRSDDIPFIVSCFSLSLDGKLLCCDLCGDEIGEWKEAAIHVYSLHLSAVEQWRDARIDIGNKSQLSKDSFDRPSADTAADDQLKQLQSAVECEVGKSYNVCKGDILVNISEHSSINSEHNIGDTFVGPSTIHLPENKIKNKLTVDECEVIASSLCKLFNCCNSEPEREMSVGKKVDAHSSSVKSVAVPTASNSKPMKAASNDMISHKCKFCHRVCSTQYHCQKHEAICRLPNSKSKDSTVRKIDGESIFYCSFCGFSDSDQQVVNAHLTKPHVTNNRLRMKPEPGHDYIGGMRVARNNFECTVCGSHQQSRLRMLIHLHRHSSLAALSKGMCITHPEPTAVKVKESTKVQSRMFYSSSSARSCPKCFRSFSSVAKYLSHRAVCRAIQHHRAVQQHGNVCKYSYLFNFCEQMSDGRWKCKLCTHCSSYRFDLYKHIRARHNIVHDTKIEAQLCVRNADGLWQCRLCKDCFACHDDVHKHIPAKHSVVLTEEICTQQN